MQQENDKSNLVTNELAFKRMQNICSHVAHCTDGEMILANMPHVQQALF